MTKYTRLIALAILSALLAGCGGNAAPESSPGPVSAEPQSLAEERGSEAITEPTTGSTTYPPTEPETEPRTVTLSERVKELELDIPEEYLEVIERETEIEASLLTNMGKEELNSKYRGAIAFTMLDPLHIVHLREINGPNTDRNEFYVFNDGEYIGVVVAPYFYLRGNTIENYYDTSWLVLTVWDAHPTKPFGNEMQIWYEITSPGFPKSLEFPTLWSVSDYDYQIFPEIASPDLNKDFYVHGTESYAEERSDGTRQFVLTVYWRVIQNGGWDEDNRTYVVPAESVETGITRYIYDEEKHIFIEEESPQAKPFPWPAFLDYEGGPRSRAE